ncbi:hypothetical protein GC170_12135 [bacterium]|nr:hypothetical protein [bacterium]
MAKNQEAYEAVARHIFDHLPEYMPYVRYAGVFLVGFVCGMLWSQYVVEEETAAKPSTRQATKKSGGGTTKIVKDGGKSTKTTKKKTAAKSTGKLLEVPEGEEAATESAEPGPFAGPAPVPQ